MIPSWSRQIPFVAGGLCILLFNSITAAAQARQLTGLAAPLVFEQNKGQVSANYEFLARRNGVEAFYFSDGMDVFVPQSQSMFTRLRLTWRGAKAGAVISGEEELPGRSNYFRGPDISRWVKGIRQFGRIRYPQIYPGVDLLFYGSGDHLEHDFVIEPGANPTQIAFHLDRPFHILPSGDTSTTTGSLSFIDNAAIPQQEVGVSGNGGVPGIFFPPVFSAPDLFVGTSSNFDLAFLNTGNGAWIVSSATASGDFSVNNLCTTALAPMGVCVMGITFNPSQAGQRTGTLTITDNAAGSPHVIQLSGNGLATYPTPSISSVLAVAMDSVSPQVLLFGTNFFPSSTVLVNGSPRSTFFGYHESSGPGGGIVLDLFAALTAADVAKPGELTIAVSNPSPGGGLSNTALAAVYAAIRNVSIMDAVFEPHAGLLYATTSTTSPTDPNQVIAIDPNTQTIVSNWAVGNSPNHLAVSDDGQLLYVWLRVNPIHCCSSEMIPRRYTERRCRLPLPRSMSFPLAAPESPALSPSLIAAEAHSIVMGLRFTLEAEKCSTQ